MNNTSPDQIKTLFSQALSAVTSSRWDIAEKICKNILALRPDQLDATYLLGLIYQNIGHDKIAISCYEKVLLLSSCHTEALINLGTIHEATGGTRQALDYYKRAVRCNPSHFLANYNLGRTSRSIGDLQTAIHSQRMALESDNESVPVLLELGLALKNRGEISAALSFLLKAKKISPDNPAIYNILGNTYQLKGELKHAISCYQSAIQLKPDFAEPYNNLGSTFVAMGDISSALKYYHQAVAIRPDWNGAASNLLLAENYISNNQKALFYKHVQWGNSLKTPDQQVPYKINNGNGNKIRIGYVSPDFRAHSVAWFLMAILKHYNHQTFNITCFSDTGSPDNVTREIRSLVDDWKNIYGLSDEDACRRVRKCNIDILVDLAGHTGNNRLGVFAMQAAPVQATYLGYPNTTGLKSIQYRITDNLADPVGIADTQHTEQLIRLPHCFLCYTPNSDTPEYSPAPFENNHYITYGSFNVLAKISEECIRTWSTILHQTPTSKLILKSAGFDDPDTCLYISKRFSEYGIDPQRIVMTPRTENMRSHLQQYSRVDITLDTFPYNGTTTTCESLWMGAPVISLAGNRHAGRVGLSLLTQIGLEELVADSHEQYVSITSDLAENPDKLLSYRETLRDRMTNSPLCNGKEFTRSIEKAIKGMLE